MAFNNRKVVIVFKRVVKGVESVLPSGREKKRGKDFADRFVFIKPQLVQLGCKVYHSHSGENAEYRTTITLEVDKDNAEEVVDLLKSAGIQVSEDNWSTDSARWYAMGKLAEHGLTTIEDFEKMARTKVYVIYVSKHLTDEDALCVNLSLDK